jgi:DNA repair protein RadC
MNIRLTKEDKIKIANTKDISKIMQRILMRQNKLHRKKEYFWVVGLNNDNTIEYIELVAIGHLNKVHIDPVEVFSFAVSKKCKKLILCHNHPSGNLKVSEEDIEITKKLEKGGAILNIRILDHFIISEEDYICVTR